MKRKMRELIPGMKMSVGAKIEGPAGFADWVDALREDYGLTSHFDACEVRG